MRRPKGSIIGWAGGAAWAGFLDGAVAAGEALLAWIKGHLAEAYLPPQDDLAVEEGRRVLREVCRLALAGMEQGGSIGRLAEAAGAAPVRLMQRLKAIDNIDGSLKRLARSSLRRRRLSSFSSRNSAKAAARTSRS